MPQDARLLFLCQACPGNPRQVLYQEIISLIDAAMAICNVNAMLEMCTPARLTRCPVPLGCWAWSKDFIPQADPQSRVIFQLIIQPLSKIIRHSEMRTPMTFSAVRSLCQPLYQCVVAGNRQPWNTFLAEAMVTLTSVEPILPREVQGCCSCVKHALVTRRVFIRK